MKHLVKEPNTKVNLISATSSLTRVHKTEMQVHRSFCMLRLMAPGFQIPKNGLLRKAGMH